MPTQGFRIPPDIVIAVLECVAADYSPGSVEPRSVEARRTISQCVLISRTWRDLALPIQWRDLSCHFIRDDDDDIFREAISYPDDPDDFVGLYRAHFLPRYTQAITKSDIAAFLRAHSDLSRHVRTLALQPLHAEERRAALGSMKPQELSSILAALPNIQNLHLSSIWLDLDTEENHRVGLPVPALERLSLSFDVNGELLPVHDMLAILSMFTNVEQVVIDRQLTDVEGARWSKPPPIQCHTRSLIINDKRALPYMLWTLAYGRMLAPGSLHTLEVGLLTPRIWSIFQHVMMLLAPTLKRLGMSLDTRYHKPSDYAHGDVDFRFLFDCTRLQYLKLCFSGVVRHGWQGDEVSGFTILYHILTYLVRPTSRLRVLRLEVDTYDGDDDKENVEIGLILALCPKYREIEDLLLRLPQLESVLIAHNYYLSVQDDVDVIDKQVINGLWPRLHEKGLLHYGRGELFDLAKFKEQCRETERWE